jgi:fructuronate reductase
MCCDNISSGGELLKDGVEYLLERHNLEALFWARKNVSFISSMVDRVSPATDDKLRDMVFQDTGQRDAAPVSAEPFSQWIIEDNFAGDRPEFDTVGAIFVDNVEPFERMKLGYLNAAHTLVSTLGYLHGDIYVHETLERPDVFRFMEEALHRNVLPNAVVPDGYDGRTYIEDVVNRFQNGNLPYANLQVGTDSSQKIQQRWFPTIDQAMKQNSDTSYFAFCIAAWIIFVQRALENDVLNDPKRSDFESVDEPGLDQIIASYLAITNVENFAFGRDVDFVTAVNAYARGIKDEGIEIALRAFLRTQRESSKISGENKHVE